VDWKAEYRQMLWRIPSSLRSSEPERLSAHKFQRSHCGRLQVRIVLPPRVVDKVSQADVDLVAANALRMARDVAPDWLSSEFDATYRVDIEGDPEIHCTMTMGGAQGHGAGRAAMAATAMRVVNAIPYVVDAPPGMVDECRAVPVPFNSRPRMCACCLS